MNTETMKVEDAWMIIINKLSGDKLEFPTVPKSKREPVWFSAHRVKDVICISGSNNHEPSSKLSTQRKLTYGIFQKVYPLYLLRENGERVSREVTAITVDQVYYFSLIHHLCK